MNQNEISINQNLSWGVDNRDNANFEDGRRGYCFIAREIFCVFPDSHST